MLLLFLKPIPIPPKEPELLRKILVSRHGQNGTGPSFRNGTDKPPFPGTDSVPRNGSTVPNFKHQKLFLMTSTVEVLRPVFFFSLYGIAYTFFEVFPDIISMVSTFIADM